MLLLSNAQVSPLTMVGIRWRLMVGLRRDMETSSSSLCHKHYLIIWIKSLALRISCVTLGKLLPTLNLSFFINKMNWIMLACRIINNLCISPSPGSGAHLVIDTIIIILLLLLYWRMYHTNAYIYITNQPLKWAQSSNHTFFKLTYCTRDVIKGMKSAFSFNVPDIN